ncbi:PAQR family membrane homeostasis protein TrhA [Haloflavibacter putidus]|uniref:Hemolysin III family protein n=1 Tax=Haloflavibacter putidus TaxID=2576776 RepID=A0A507ZRT2_9FLAO|nr:hemolysin III family protein [Haloflavibacter putidus]TQD39717.1 hemolysin III family protein [Haloflavibacter putidus]
MASQRSGYYPPTEEKWNVYTHAFGLVMSCVGLIFLILRANRLEGYVPLVSFSIFGASMILLYAASTFYHSAKEEKIRYHLNILDHAAIFVLIAGTYTPFTLITLSGFTGWLIFGIVWGIALLGIILKLFFTGRYRLLSTIIYVFMGTIILFAIKPLTEKLPLNGLYWVLGGGVAYVLGAILFSIRKIPFNHAIFHVMVLLGSFAHYMAIYHYVLPG